MFKGVKNKIINCLNQINLNQILNKNLGDRENLLNELKNYNKELLDKERIVVISKSDLINQKERLAIKNKLKTNLQKIESHFISAVTLEGVVELKDLIWNKLNS